MTAATANTVGTAIANTALNVAAGVDPSTALQNAAISAALPVVGKEATDLISKTLTESNITGTVNDIITRGAAQGATAAILGKDPLAAFVLGGTTAGVTAITSNIPDFDKLPKPAQNAIGSAIAAQVTGRNVSGAVTQSLVNDAINWAKTEVNKVPDAIKSAQAKYKADSGGTLTDEQLEKLLKENGADKLVSAVDNLYTTKAEASALWEKELGYKPSEFDLLKIEGLSTPDVKSVIDDKSSTTYDEAESFLKNLYGDRYTPTKDEITSLMGLKEVDAEKQAGQQYNTWVDDRNTVTNDELTNFLKKAGLKEEDLSESQLLSALKTTEAGAETYLQRLADQKATTFDGEKYKSQVEAQNAAIKNGYNTYTWDGKSYTLMSPEQAQQLQADRAAGKNVGVSPDIIVPIKGKTLEQQLKDSGNPDEYAYMQGDTIVVVSKRMAVPDYNDSAAWDAFQAEKKALGGDNFQSYLTEKFSILEQAMKGAPEGSVAKMAASAAMWGYGKVANLAQTMMRTAEAAGMNSNTAGIRIANQVEKWSNKLVDQGIQNAEAAVSANIAAVTKETIAAAKGVPASKISDAELYYEKSKALLGQVKNNPLGVGLFVGGEAVQEIPFLAASGGIGRVFASVAGKTVGMSAALGSDVALNGAESFGGNYGEVKDYLMKQGVPEAKAHALAVTSGFEAMGVSMATAFVGDRKLVQAFVGDLAKDSFTKLALTTSTKEWLLGNVEGYLQNVSAQIGKYGSFKSQDEAMNSALLEGLAQHGIATGVISASKLDQVVAKDYDGKNVTLKQIIDGNTTFDPKTINKDVSLGGNMTVGSAFEYKNVLEKNPDVSPSEFYAVDAALRSNGMSRVTANDIIALAGSEGETKTQDISKSAATYADQFVFTADEAKAAAALEGYKLTDAEAAKLAGQKNQAEAIADIKKQYGPLSVTEDEARQFFKDIGYTPTDAEVKQFVKQAKEADVKTELGAYVNERQVTRAEAEQFFKDIGYKPTEEEIKQFIRQGPTVQQEAIKTELGAYVDPRMVDEAEARAAYESLGLKKPTQADVLKLVGQYGETDLAGKAQANLDPARYNAIIAQLDEISKQPGVDPAALEIIKKDLNDQIKSLGGDINKLSSGVTEQIGSLSADVKTKYDALTAEQKALADQLSKQGVDLRTAIDVAAKQTQQQVADVQAKYNALSADQKALADALRQQGVDLNTAIETVRAQTQEQIGGLSADLQSKYNALTAEQKALADQLRQQGIDTASAIEQARTAISADVQAKYDSLNAGQKALADQLAQQGVDLRTAIDVAAKQTQQQVVDLGATLNQRVDELVAQGKTQYEATQQAIAEVSQKNVQLQELVGTQAKPVTQQDITAVQNMLSGNQQVNLAYDVNNDKQITQADLDYLTKVVSGQNTDWTAPAGSPWAPTGLYGQIAEVEAKRQADLKAAEAARQADIQAQIAREKEAARQSEIRTTASQAQTQIQSLISQLPQAYKAAQTTTTPIYGGEITPFSLEAPLDVGFFSPSKEKQTSQPGQQATKIASGGYIDDLLDLLRG